MSRPRFIALLLVLGTLAVYLPAAHHGFSLYDDNDYVTENPMVENGLTRAGIQWAFTTCHASNWHPLTWLSHLADCQLFGLDAGMHHSVNVLFHAANSVLLLLLLMRWTNAVWPGAFAAALFAWHPLHVESVAWVAERKDVLSTFFALLTMLAYTRFVEESKVHPPSPNSGATRSPKPKVFYGLALLAFALGLMAKPMLVTLPFVMLLLDCWPLQRFESCMLKVGGSKAGRPATFNLQLVIEKTPFFALSAASCVITFMAQHRGGAVASLENVPFHYRLENVPVAYAGYLFKMIWPAHLAVFYPLNPPSPLELAAAVAAAVAISWLAWEVRRPRPYWLVGWLWFLGTLVPVIGLVQVGGAALADRYTYFPGIGIFLAVALGLRDGAKRLRVSKPILGATAGLVLAACLALTHRQLNFWRDDITLFSHAIAVTRNNDTAHLNLGFAFEKAGQKDKALAEYRAALKLNPDRAETHNNIANLLDDTGHPEEAAAQYQEALRINPGHVPSHDNYGTLLVELGRFEEAMQQYADAARLDPADWHPPFLSGKALLKQGRDPEAIAYFRQAVKLDPNNPGVLIYLAQVLASDENPRVRDGHTAYKMAFMANQLTDGLQTAMLDTLAMAYAELGRFDDAQNAAQDALKLATAYKMTNDVAIIQEHLQLYQNRQPFRQSFLFTNAPAKKME